MLDLEFAELSDKGPTRQHNEDYCGHLLPATAAEARSRGWLFALADGVGGQAGGEIASRLAVETLLLPGNASAPSSDEPVSAALPRLIQAANERVYEASGQGFRPGTIATTIVACALRFDRAVVAHVGDSRCYLVRRGQAHALTRDHTVAAEQLRMGILTTRQTSRADTGHLLSRCLGSELFVKVDVSDHLILAGDVLLLCSDGLHHSVKPEDIAGAVGDRTELKAAAEHLVSLANRRDGSDNVSVQLVRIRAVESVGMYRGRLYRLPKPPPR